MFVASTFAPGNEKNASGITIGTVVSTSDPQQMGRIKVVCPLWGDTFDTELDSLPWAVYVSPFGGTMSVGARGPGVQTTEGSVGYGFWAIPKVGSQVLVVRIDGDSNFRAYFGSIYDHMKTHTLPHGRYKYDQYPGQSPKGGAPYGPFSSSDKPIQPLYNNYRSAFGSSATNYEWQTRGADYQAAAIGPQHLNFAESNIPDDYKVADPASGWVSTQGYDTSAHDAEETESKVTALVSPGFHSISMDDRMQNCRMRFRTTSGHQILLDDTNERIYISTAQGNNWVEMDQDGDIDVYSSQKVSIRSARELNLTSDDTVRIHGKKGVHVYSGDDVNIQAVKNVNVKVGHSLLVGTGQNIKLTAGQHIESLAGNKLMLTSGANTEISSGGKLYMTSQSHMEFNIGDDYVITVADDSFYNDSRVAVKAGKATDANEQPAKWTSKTPAHEPYARVMTKNDYTHAPEHSYSSDNVNRLQRGRSIIRGLFWRR